MQFVKENNENVSAVDAKWWVGIVANEESWIGNEKTTKWAGENSIPGYGQRYKVRIVGKHDKSEIKDEDLEVCNVIYPVTAGSGHANSKQSASLKQGSIVVGVTKDGNDGTEYWILGVIGNQDQTQLAGKSNPSNGFETRSGYGDNPFRQSDGVDITDIPSGGENQGRPLEASTSNNNLRKRDADDQMEKDAKKSADLPTKKSCSGSELLGIQLFIRNMIQDIESKQKSLTDFSNAVNSVPGEIQKYIDKKIEQASEFIGGKIKSIIEEVRKNTLSLIEKTIRTEYVNVWPTDRPLVKKIQDEVWDKVSCVFNKFISILVNLVTNVLKGLFDKIINVPICLAQNLSSAIISQILGTLIGLINNALTPLFAILGIATNLGSSILNLIKGLLGFFSCEETEECPETTSWNFWTGPGSVSGGNPLLDIDSIFNAAMDFAGTIGDAVDSFSDFSFDAGGAVASILSAAQSCLTDFISCGPPKVEFYGSPERNGGQKAFGNAIVSAAGDILGIDVVVPGFGYGSNVPAVSIIDNCGTGRGSTGIAIMTGTDGTGGTGGTGGTPLTVNGTPLTVNGTPVTSGGLPVNAGGTGAGTGIGAGGTGAGTGIGAGGGGSGGGPGSVDYVLITTPGDGYLSRNNGTKGGDGRIWAKRNQTIVKRKDKKWEIPYYPGSPIELLPGDEVTIPDGTFIDIPPTFTTPRITIPGGIPIVIPDEQSELITIVAPEVVSELPIVPTEPTYDVLLTICNPVILNGGINYRPGDQIVIEPNSGAELEPVFGPLGNLIDINVINPGSGFDSWPRIYIDSETGYNAKIVPNFCITRLTKEDIDKLSEGPEGVKIVSVVDCVGKFIKN